MFKRKTERGFCLDVVEKDKFRLIRYKNQQSTILRQVCFLLIFTFVLSALYPISSISTVYAETSRAGNANIIYTSQGGRHTLLLKDDGTVWVYGCSTNFGHGANPHTTRHTIDRDSMRQVPRLENVVSIVAGYLYSVALKEDGTVWFWGSTRGGNISGLPRGARNPNRFSSFYTRPQKVYSLSDIVAISNASNNTGDGRRSHGSSIVALSSDGTLWIWGSASVNDEQARAFLVPRRRIILDPTQINGLADVVSISRVESGVDTLVKIVRSDGQTITWENHTFYMSESVLFYQNPAGNRSNVNPELVSFLEFIVTLSHEVASNYSSEIDKIRAVYNFIVLNFEYRDGRDGSAVDGSRRPQQIPQVSSFVRNADGGVTIDPMKILSMGGIDEIVAVIGAWGMLQYGDGVCDDFAALFALMLLSLDINAVLVLGQYINTDGSSIGHMWVAVEIEENFYFFDPQIEASNLTRRTTNRSDIPYHWFRQPLDSSLTQQRYDTRGFVYIPLRDIIDIGSTSDRVKYTPIIQQTQTIAQSSIAITLNGASIPNDVPPTIIDGRTVVPVRAVTEALGANVDWDGATRSVTITRGANIIVMTIDSNSATVDTRATTLDVAPILINDTTMLPIRFIAESFNLDVDWDEADRTVIITTP